MKTIPKTFQRFRNWVETVDYSDPEQKRLAINLQWAAIISITASLLFSLIYTSLMYYPRTAHGLVLTSFILSISIWLVRNKYQMTGNIVFFGALLGIITYELYMRNGVHSIEVILYPIIVVVASSILSRRIFLIFLGFVLLSLGFVLHAEDQGWILFKSLESSSFAIFLIYSLILGSTALVSKLLNESLQMALSRERQNERELAAQKTMLDRIGQAVVGCQIDSTIIYWNQAATNLYGWKAEEALGRQYYEVVPTQLSPEMAESIRTALRKGEVWSGEMAVQRRDQSSLSIIGTIAPLHDVRGTITGWIGIATDLTEREKTEQIARRRADEISLLYQVGAAVASGMDLYSTLLTFQREIAKLTQADAFFVAIYNKDTDIVSFPIFVLDGKPSLEPERLLHEQPGLTGAVIFGCKTLYLSDMMTREVEDTYHPHDNNTLILHSFLGIPLVVNERVIGMVSIQSKLLDAYSREQIQFMENIAVHAAIAIDKARLLDQLKQELIERKRVEEDLRQRETLLEAVTFAAEQFLKTPDWRANIDTVLERLGKTIHAAHAYLFENHPDKDGDPTSSMHFEWTAPGYPSDMGNPDFQSISLEEKGFESYFEKLRKGEPFIGNVSSFLPAEKEFFTQSGIKAMVEVPLFVNGQWWGTIGFDDFEQEREWSSAEVDVLKVAAGILGTAIQRQKADEAVQESERIYRQAIEAADAVPYYRDYGLNSYIFMGEGIEKIIGYKPSEVTPDLWNEIIKELIPLGETEGLSFEEAQMRSRAGKIKTWKSDVRVRARNGEERWLTDSAIELFENEEISHASIGILQDITGRKKTEANLRQREAILDAVAASAELLFKTPDWKTEINDLLERVGKSINASHAYLFENEKLESGELINSMLFEWTAPGYPGDIGDPTYTNAPLKEIDIEAWYRMMIRGFPYIGDMKHSTPAEMEFLFERGMKALLDVPIFIDGEWWGTIGFDDMANEREWTGAEIDALKVAANVLGAAIQRQIADAALQNELSQRKKLIEELEAKNSELEQFTYTVSHDLKSPLVTINGFLGYLEQDALSGNTDRLKHDMQRIQEAVTRMQRLLGELLELSRIGRLMNPSETMPFEDLARAAVDIVDGQLKARGITVILQPNLPAIYGDRQRLVEVLQNLLDNAAKFMGDQPDPRIEIGQRGEDAERGKLIFYVKDNGIGIAPEYHDRIFGLFNKLNPKAEGTGIGLALVKRIIEVHGGRVWIESEVGKGSTFCFTLGKEAVN